MSTPMPDPPRDDDLSEAEFHVALENMLARVSAAANDAQRSRPDSSGDAVAAESSIGGSAKGGVGASEAATAQAPPDAPGSTDAPALDEADSSNDVWADTTPFWPADPADWQHPVQGAPAPGAVPPPPIWAWTLPKATGDSSSGVPPPDVDGPIAGQGDAPPPGWMRRASPLALALAAVVVVGWGAWQAMPPKASSPPTASLDALPPTSAGPVAAAAVIAQGAPPRGQAPAIAIDADASTESRMRDELARSVGSPGRPADGGAAARLTIARYDTLPAASAGWQVVATLGTEEVYALVPVGSTLRHLGDLRGRRINVGPDGSPRAVSGAALYRAMFDASPPTSNSSALPRDDAVRQMLATGEPEAVLLFDGQPSSWLAALPASTRHALRLLRLDPADPAGRRALQRYLPGHLAPGVDGNGDTIPTLREVTFLIAPASAPDAAPVLRALCDHLPALRLDGHPKWREVEPTLSLPIGLRRPGQLDAALATCAPAPSIPSTPRRSS